MNMKVKFLTLLILVSGLTYFSSCKKSSDDNGGNSGPTEYVSPYKLDSIFTYADLGADFAQRDLLNPSTMDTSQWNNPSAPEYNNDTLIQMWGPPPAEFGSEAGYPHDSLWQMQRLVYVAQRYLKTIYQHHYLLQWKPPSNWPWDKRDSVTYGKQSAGIDAPNFTAWVYNYALGLHLGSKIDTQYNKLTVNGYGEIPFLNVKVIQKTAGFNELVGALKPGDLLFFTDQPGGTKPFHVAIWVGKPYAASNEYLLIDCWDRRILDSRGGIIPAGIYIRPFTADGYYFARFLKAHRIAQKVF
jgi:cell wall-associated NlpC family hydrolase